MSNTIRCKFLCIEVVSRKSQWANTPNKMTHGATFQPVTSGSEENKAFFEATPSGTLKFETIKELPFEPGAEYYIDITKA